MSHQPQPRQEDRARPSSRPVRIGDSTLSLLALEPTIRALETDIDRARERVWIETFIFRGDKFGQRIAERLVAARARGVDVRVMYDVLGSRTTPQRFFDALGAKGVEVRPYRSWPMVLKALRMWPRDHARILCIDDAGYTGGLGFGDEWLPAAEGGHGWHDLCVRVEGGAARMFCHCFERAWQAQEESGDTDTRECDGKKLSLVTDSPLDARGVYARFREVVQRAQRRIWIENAYFMPPRRLLQDLVEARARGVEVQIVLPGDSDLPAIERAARAAYAGWIDGGLEIFEYPGVTHAKVAVVDDAWCTVGSFNLNATSVVCSRESNLFVYDPAFVAVLAEQFVQDRARSRRVNRDDAARQPLHTRLIDHGFHGGLRTFEALSRLAGYPWT
jgi:cardiolipin synthase